MIVNIVGCGLSGITAAAILKKNHKVRIFDTRNHIGGNCYDSNVYGVLMHCYGPHIFHTNDEEVFSFLSQYTEWLPFDLRPVGNTELGKISLPYSKKTVKEIGRELSQPEISDLIFRHYSEKQWGVPFSEIPSFITNRIPKTINSENPTWFEGEKYQCVPKHGYTKMFEKMLDGVDIQLNYSKEEWRGQKSDLTIYTGKIDEYFDFKYGRLPYRSLDFVHKVSSEKMPHFIENSNTKKEKYTRKYDHSYFLEKHSGLTIITEEFPKECKNDGVPFYPIPWGNSLTLYQKYKILADNEERVVFLGRLANYKYLDMWMAVKNGMNKLRGFA